VEKAQSMVANSGISPFLWTEVINYANHLVNRGPTRANQAIILELKYYNKCLDVSLLRTFGCIAYSHVPKVNMNKLESKTRSCLMVGFDDKSKAYRLYDPTSKRIILNRDIKFDKNLVGFQHLGLSQVSPRNMFPDSLQSNISEPSFLLTDEHLDQESATTGNSNTDIVPLATDSDPAEGSLNSNSTTARNHMLIPNQEPTLQQSHTETVRPGRRLSTREHRPSSCLKDYYLFFTKETTEPRTFGEAIEKSEWKIVIQQEIDSINKNCTWIYVDLSLGKKVIMSKWIFKEKVGPSEKVEKLKARLVAKGFMQIESVNFCDTFAHVVRWSIIRIFISIATTKKRHIH
jgi:hypothetical protein